MVSERVNDGIERSPALWFRRAAMRRKERASDPASGGARKTTALRPRAWLLWVREMIGKLINLALRIAGLSCRVDHRSNASRGLVRVPQPKLGPCAAWLERQELVDEAERPLIDGTQPPHYSMVMHGGSAVRWDGSGCLQPGTARSRASRNDAVLGRLHRQTEGGILRVGD